MRLHAPVPHHMQPHLGNRPGFASGGQPSASGSPTTPQQGSAGVSNPMQGASQGAQSMGAYQAAASGALNNWYGGASNGNAGNVEGGNQWGSWGNGNGAVTSTDPNFAVNGGSGGGAGGVGGNNPPNGNGTFSNNTAPAPAQPTPIPNPPTTSGGGGGNTAPINVGRIAPGWGAVNYGVGGYSRGGLTRKGYDDGGDVQVAANTRPLPPSPGTGGRPAQGTLPPAPIDPRDYLPGGRKASAHGGPIGYDAGGDVGANYSLNLGDVADSAQQVYQQNTQMAANSPKTIPSNPGTQPLQPLQGPYAVPSTAPPAPGFGQRTSDAEQGGAYEPDSNQAAAKGGPIGGIPMRGSLKKGASKEGSIRQGLWQGGNPETRMALQNMHDWNQQGISAGQTSAVERGQDISADTSKQDSQTAADASKSNAQTQADAAKSNAATAAASAANVVGIQGNTARDVANIRNKPYGIKKGGRVK